MELAIVADGGEGFLFDRSGAELDAAQNARVEDVDTGIDAVAHELNWLLDETVDAARVVRGVDNDTVLAGLFDLGHHNGALVTVLLVEGG